MENTTVFENKRIHPHCLMRSNSLPSELTRKCNQGNEDFNTYSQIKLEISGRNQNLGGSIDSKLRYKGPFDWTDFEWRNEHTLESLYSVTDIESDFEKFNSKNESKYKLQNDGKSETPLGRKCEAKNDGTCESVDSRDCESAIMEGLFENHDLFLVKEKENSLELLKNIWFRKDRQVPGKKTGQTASDRPDPKSWQPTFERLWSRTKTHQIGSGGSRSKTGQTSSDGSESMNWGSGGSGSKTGQTSSDGSESMTWQISSDESGSNIRQIAYRQETETWQSSSESSRTEIGQNTSERSENESYKIAFDIKEQEKYCNPTRLNSEESSRTLIESDVSSEEIDNDDYGQHKNDLFGNNWSESSEISGQEMRVKIIFEFEQVSDMENSSQIDTASERSEIIPDQKQQDEKAVVKKLKLLTDEDNGDLNGQSLFKRKTSKVLQPRQPVDTLPTKHSLIKTQSDVNSFKANDHFGKKYGGHLGNQIGGHLDNRNEQHKGNTTIFGTKEARNVVDSLDSKNGKQNEHISSASKTYRNSADNQNENISNSTNLYGIFQDGYQVNHNKEKEQFSLDNYSRDLDDYEGQSLESEGHHSDPHENITSKKEIKDSNIPLSSSSDTTVQITKHVCHHQDHHCCGHHHHNHHHDNQDGFQNGDYGHYSHHHSNYSRKQDQMMQISLVQALAESAGFEIHDVMPDGNCMYRSVVDQLRMHGELEISALSLRQMSVEFLTDNPCHEDGTHLQEFLSAETWDEYLERMKKDGEWGDQIMLRGVAEVTGRKICIISAIGDSHNQITIEPSKAEADQSEKIFLGHIDDYHYVSLRPKNWRDIWYENVKKKIQNKRQKSDLSKSEQREVNLLGQRTKQMLENQNQGDESLKFPSRDELVDTTSVVPYCHLSFIIRHVLSKNHFHTTKYDWESYANWEQSTSDSKVYVVGSAVENFEFTIGSNSPVKSSNAFQRRNCQSENKIKTPKCYILADYHKKVIFNGENASDVHDVIAVTEEVHPGYLRLHPFYPSSAINITWIRGHIPCLNSEGFFNTKNSDLPNEQQKTVNGGSRGNNKKYVLAVYWSESWPELALKWVTRDRPSGWPRQDVVQQVLNDGCFIVPIHHPMSEHPECEWRFSFALSEKRLAFTISKAQRYCFQVFKALVDYFTGDKELLSTYFLKTVFFHVCEAIAKLYWRIQPASCILYLFDKLLLCLRQKNLPHYFILENNIIDHFHDNDIHCLITRLEAVRNCPAIASCSAG
ncbi:hypothetical protein KUTeg_006041 [Tegillarca granosa]|uniref:OTU domain-containing protein n=1 Tax=Tegillarca granosa TaxID=220873 RepID=A0ABQ9FFB0_TEGGR|nr:hypothetical protein KUTeg_006041 [Tegillarca granosa]